MQMIYEQFLCCFRHHTEAWMSYINFVCSFSGDVNYRELYKEAMSANPTTALLRVAAAEKEELMGDIEAAKGILSQAYEEIPSGFTFSILQRLVRRTEGVKAARKLFSDSYPTRLKSPKLGIEVSMANSCC